MNLSDLIHPKNSKVGLAAAIPAIPATDGWGDGLVVARIATVAVANPRNEKAANSDTESEPRRLWLIRHDDGRLVSHSFTPPATDAEVRGWYPGALAIEEDGHE